MAENTRRGLFTLSGITGMLIATVLLLSILAFLTIKGIAVQREAITKPYDPTPVITNLDAVKKISKDNAKYDLTKR